MFVYSSVATIEQVLRTAGNLSQTKAFDNCSHAKWAIIIIKEAKLCTKKYKLTL